MSTNPNAREIHRRGAINPKDLRDALALWFGELCPARRLVLTQTRNFGPLAKALAKLFPARRPVQHSGDELYEKVCQVPDPIAAGLVPVNGWPSVAGR